MAVGVGLVRILATGEGFGSSEQPTKSMTLSIIQAPSQIVMDFDAFGSNAVVRREVAVGRFLFGPKQGIIVLHHFKPNPGIAIPAARSKRTGHSRQPRCTLTPPPLVSRARTASVTRATGRIIEATSRSLRGPVNGFPPGRLSIMIFEYSHC